MRFQSLSRLGHSRSFQVDRHVSIVDVAVLNVPLHILQVDRDEHRLLFFMACLLLSPQLRDLFHRFGLQLLDSFIDRFPLIRNRIHRVIRLSDALGTCLPLIKTRVHIKSLRATGNVYRLADMPV